MARLEALVAPAADGALQRGALALQVLRPRPELALLLSSREGMAGGAPLSGGARVAAGRAAGSDTESPGAVPIGPRWSGSSG